MEDDDDIVITGGTLGVAALAPHHRYYGCPENRPLIDPSTKKPTASDALKFCRLCVCYVCDTPASQCTQWKDHCEAAPAGYARPGGRDWAGMRRQVRADAERARADAAWVNHEKPRMSGAWVNGTTPNPFLSVGWNAGPSAAPAQIPTAVRPCVIGTNPRRVAQFVFTSPRTPPALDRAGWALRDLRSMGQANEWAAPAGAQFLHNWPVSSADRPVLDPDDEERRLLAHTDMMRSGVFVSVLIIAPSHLQRRGMTIVPQPQANAPRRRPTLGDLIARIEADTPSVNGAWRGIVIGREGIKDAVFEMAELLDNDAVHVFDVKDTYMWVCTDWAPPIAVSLDAPLPTRRTGPDKALVDRVYESLSGICDDVDPLPQPQAVSIGPLVSRNVGTVLASFQKAPLLLCRSFEDDAFAIQPEKDPELHDHLIKMWLRDRATSRITMWESLQKASEQKVVYNQVYNQGDSANFESAFTTSVTVSGMKISVDVFISDSLSEVVKRCGFAPGHSSSSDGRVASFHSSHGAESRAVMNEIRNRSLGAESILRDMIFRYRFRHAFGRDTGTVLRVAQQGSVMRRRTDPPPPAAFVSACRDRGLFEWQARQVWSYTNLPRSIEWREIMGDGKGVRVFVNVHEPAIRIGASRSRVAGAMVNGTGLGKTVMAAMIPLLPMWDEIAAPDFDFSSAGASSSAPDPRADQMEAMRAKDRESAVIVHDTTPVNNLLSMAGLAAKPVSVLNAAPTVAAGGIRAGVLVVTPPHLVMQWVAELKRMGPNFLRFYDVTTKKPAKGKVKEEHASDPNELAQFAYGAHRVVLTSFRKFSGSDLTDHRLNWSTVIFDESQLATTKTIGRFIDQDSNAYERARSQVNANRILALSASPMAKDVRDLRAWLKDGYRDMPQYSLRTLVSGFAVPVPPSVASEIFECFFNEKVDVRKPKIETTVIEVPMGAAEQITYVNVLKQMELGPCVCAMTKRSILMKLTSGAPLLYSDVNGALPSTTVKVSNFAACHPSNPAVQKTLNQCSEIPCAIGSVLCDPTAKGFLFPSCGHWVCSPCAGFNVDVATNHCSNQLCMGHAATDVQDLSALAKIEITRCVSKIAAVEREAKADLAADPASRFVMVGASEDAVKAVCAHLNAAEIPSRVVQLGAGGGRVVDRFNAGNIKVILIKRSQNMGLDLFAATHLYILTPAETAASALQMRGRVSRLSTLSDRVCIKEFISVGAGGVVTIDQALRNAAAKNPDGNAKLSNNAVESLFDLNPSDDEEDEEAGPGFRGNPSTAHIAHFFFDTKERRKKDKRKRSESYGCDSN